MAKDLTTSPIDRKNILNNNHVVKELYYQVGFSGVLFEGKYRFTKTQVSRYFEVDVRTIERLLENNGSELVESGYELFTGVRLKELRNCFREAFRVENTDVSDNFVGDMLEIHETELINPKAPSIGIFTFKSFLNVGMLLAGSERAKELRSAILDIVIDVLNTRLGGSTKYINQREEEFLPSAIREFNYREAFTNALDHYVVENKFKYAQLTDRIYQSIFKENAKEYRQILKLNAKESVRSTFYSEVLDLIASYENGFAGYLKEEFEKSGKKIRLNEAHTLFNKFEEHAKLILEPLREKARSLMASRDMAFRDALHEKLKEYINSVSSADFEKFLGEKSKILEQRIAENRDVFERLKLR